MRNANSFSTPRIMDLSGKERVLATLPLVGGMLAGVLLVPWAMILAGVPERLAFAVTPAFAGMIGLFLAMDSRPANTRHLIILGLTLLAMVTVGHLVSALTHYLTAPAGDATGGGGFKLALLKSIACIGAAVCVWFAIKWATRGESLWKKPKSEQGDLQ